MSVKKFRFVSPGIFINEIDRSQVPRTPARMGPVIIGRSERGPGFRPTTVHSYAEFVEIFGNPIPGGEVDDVWRNGNYDGPTYGAYAAQAYLRNNNPVTFVRLLGAHHDSNEGTNSGVIGNHGSAGWQTTNLQGSGGGAYGLFVMPSASLGISATAVDALDTTGMGNDTKITISIPVAAGGESSTGTIIFFDASETTDPAEGENMIAIGTSVDSDADIAAQLIHAINGTTGANVDFASSGVGTAGVQGVTAAQGSSDTQVTLTITKRGTAGNSATIASTLDGLHSIVDVTTFTGATTDEQVRATGSLAAVWYLDSGYMQLSGAIRGTETGSAPINVSGSSVLIGNVDKFTWKAVIKDSSNAKVVETAFSFDPDSDNYIRKTFNTNPQLVNTGIYDSSAGTTTNYWLGESFDRSVQNVLTPDGKASSSANQCWGLLLQLGDGTNEYAKQMKEHIPSETGWIISQDTSNSAVDYDALNQQRAKRLFKFVSLDEGSEWNQSNVKISIEDIRPAKSDKSWATFTVTVRAIDDTDKSLKILEKFTGCNLNASSPNYVARKIGDKEFTYDKVNKQLKVGGNYDNKSRYVRVKTNEAVYAKDLVPFGCYGPPRYKGFTFFSGAAGSIGGSGGTAQASTFVRAGSNMDFEATGSKNQQDGEGNNAFGEAKPQLTAGEIWCGYETSNNASARLTASLSFAALSLRGAGTDGGIIDQSKAYWGVDTTKTGSGNIRYDSCVPEYLKTLAGQTSRDTIDFHLTSTNAECQFVFTLDDLVETNGSDVFYTSGSRQESPNYSATSPLASITAKSGSSFLLTASTMGHDKFTTVLYGGFDGFDIREKTPFNTTRGLQSAATEKNSYAYYSVTKAIEVVKDPERVECNLLAMPGVVNTNLTTRLVRVAEERADTLAIIDIQKDFTPTGENTNSDMANQGTVDEAVRDMKDRKIDSSYGAAYYPWVQIQDTRTNQILWAPPSVVALGAMAYSDSVKDVWFAPAGFNRGGLTSTGAGGVPVVGVNQQLTSKQRDKLYEVNVNPIASFPAEGIVIFGQKTLQLTPSALDRINVRRLLIFLKKEVSRIASTILFEPNLEQTWATFTARTEVLLNSVKQRLGLADYKLVLDKTTTTPDLVDRNIMYAKVYLKPARAIEFIALDFIITRSGASFED